MVACVLKNNIIPHFKTINNQKKKREIKKVEKL